MQTIAQAASPNPIYRDIPYSIPWNLFLLTLGTLFIAIAINGIAIFPIARFSSLSLILRYPQTSSSNLGCP